MPKTITAPNTECWDPVNERFIYKKGGKIVIEHSLVSISKWESKWKVHFLGNDKITPEQFIDYIKCMTITQNVNEEVYEAISYSKECLEEIAKYIEDPMTATTVNERMLGGKGGGYRANKIITSEQIYAWMCILKIPFECQKWHINRLLMLIKVVSIEKQPPKKMNPREAMAQQRSLNAARRAKHHSRG